MDWLDPQDTLDQCKIIIHKKILTVADLQVKNQIKNITNIKCEWNNYIENPEKFFYTKGNQKRIKNYFELTSQIKEICNKISNENKKKFMIFATHPQFKKFLRKVNEKFNPNWKYNFKILEKDEIFLRKMKEILRKICVDTSENYEFVGDDPERTDDWKHVMKESIELIKNEAFVFKFQLKYFYNKYKYNL